LTTSADETPAVQEKFWVKELKLTFSHKRCIESGEWLSDDIIDAFQELLKLSYAEVKGLQDTILGEALSFEICQGKFLQILNINRNHWIVVSSDEKNSHVTIYDSLSIGEVSTDSHQKANSFNLFLYRR
jgi:Ulp1 family protease